MLAIHLRDIDHGVVSAWQAAFAGVTGVDASRGDIFETPADAIVSPANSFGYMDGGIDLVYSRFFGWELEVRLKALLVESHYGELPVGQAVVLPTGHGSIPYLVSAPTMRVPGNIAGTLNVYLAFRAALIAVLGFNREGGKPIGSVLVPGLGTGIGGVPPERAAKQMRLAYDAVVGGVGISGRSAREVLAEHHRLMALAGTQPIGQAQPDPQRSTGDCPPSPGARNPAAGELLGIPAILSPCG